MVQVQPPSYLQLEPVGQCNLRCRMCPIQFRDAGPPLGPPAFMDFDLFQRILDDLPSLRLLHLQGLGEPLMHPRFFDMVRYAGSRGIEVTTNSNLTLLNERRAGLCIDSGLSTLNVSLDGATPETYEWVRVRARFDRVVANLERLVAAKRRAGASRPRLNLVFVLMRSNLEELPALIDLASRLGFDEVAVQQLCHDFGEDSLPQRYQPMRGFVDSETVLSLDESLVEDVFASARKRAAATGLALSLPRVRPRAHPPGTPGRARCDWPWTGAYVTYDGWSMPCCMISTPDRANFGQLAPGRSIVDIWQGGEYEAFRARLDSAQPPGICSSCAVYHGTF